MDGWGCWGGGWRGGIGVGCGYGGLRGGEGYGYEWMELNGFMELGVFVFYF